MTDKRFDVPLSERELELLIEALTFVDMCGSSVVMNGEIDEAYEFRIDTLNHLSQSYDWIHSLPAHQKLGVDRETPTQVD